MQADLDVTTGLGSHYSERGFHETDTRRKLRRKRDVHEYRLVRSNCRGRGRHGEMSEIVEPTAELDVADAERARSAIPQ